MSWCKVGDFPSLGSLCSLISEGNEQAPPVGLQHTGCGSAPKDSDQGLLQKRLSLLAIPPAGHSSVCGVLDVHNMSDDGRTGQGWPPHVHSNHLPRATWYKRSMCESLI